jgi:WD40 repeat protein
VLAAGQLFADINLKHADLVRRVALSPGGKMLATVEDSGAVNLWDLATGKRLSRWHHRKSRFVQVAFAKDGKTLTVYDLELLAICEVPTGKILSKSAGRDFLTRHGAGRIEDGAVRLWDIDKSMPVKVWRRPGVNSRTVGTDKAPFCPVSADGEQLAVLYGDTLTVLSTDTLKERVSFTVPSAISLESALFSPDKQFLAIGCQENACLWDLSTGKIRGYLDWG